MERDASFGFTDLFLYTADGLCHTLGLPAPVTVCPFEVFTSILLLLFQPPTLLVVSFLLLGQEGAVLGLPELVGFVLGRAGRAGRTVVCRMQLGYDLIAVFAIEFLQIWGWFVDYGRISHLDS